MLCVQDKTSKFSLPLSVITQIINLLNKLPPEVICHQCKIYVQVNVFSLVLYCFPFLIRRHLSFLKTYLVYNITAISGIFFFNYLWHRMCLESTQITLFFQLQYFFVTCFASNCNFRSLLPIFDNITKILFEIFLLKTHATSKSVFAW